jgi:hypothetical protein
MKSLNVIATLLVAVSISGCAAIDDFDWNRKGPSYETQKAAQDAELKVLQKNMSKKEKDAIYELCAKQVSNLMTRPETMNDISLAIGKCNISQSK